MPTFDYSLDNEPQSTDQQKMTPNEILRKGGFDPAAYYLVEIEPNAQKSFQGKGDEPIEIHEHEKFVAIFTGPVPVS